MPEQAPKGKGKGSGKPLSGAAKEAHERKSGHIDQGDGHNGDEHECEFRFLLSRVPRERRAMQAGYTHVCRHCGNLGR